MKSNPQSPSLDYIKYILGAYDNALRPQVAQCQDIRNILELVSDNCPLDDITLLEFFVDKFNIEEAKPAIKEYKEAVDEFKMKICQCLEEQLLKDSSPLELECVTIVVDKDAGNLVFNDVKRLSSAVFENLSPHVRLNVIRSDGDSGTWELWKQKSFTAQTTSRSHHNSVIVG